MLAVGGEYENALGLAKDRYVRIVRDKDYLTASLNCLQRSNDSVVNESVVEIVFRLINQQGSFTLSQQDRQDRRASLPRREVR